MLLMNKFFWVTFVASLSLTLTSCSKDSETPGEALLDGVWQLTAWNVDGGMDMDKDGVSHTNLLDEISCSSNETLEFDNSGVVSFNNAFNPDIKIIAVNNLVENLNVTVVCDNGVLGTATVYTVNGKTITIGSTTATINGNEINIVRKGKLKVLNTDMSTVLSTMDVIEVYTKM